MAVLNTVSSILSVIPAIAEPGGMWASLILKVFGFIANYGWRIVVFTVLLKLVISPLDFYQRYKMNKNQKITERLKPTMDKLRKQYAGDERAFSQKQMELNRKEGYSYFSACLPMIITLVVFITMFTSMRTVSQYMTLEQYTTMYDQYTVTREAVLEQTGDEEIAEAFGQEVVYRLYYDGMNDDIAAEIKRDVKNKFTGNEDPDKNKDEAVLDAVTLDLDPSDHIKEGWGWIENVWSPDVPWKGSTSFFGSGQAVLDWTAFNNAIGSYGPNAKNNKSGLEPSVLAGYVNEATYNNVMYKLLNENAHRDINGYLILPVLVVLLSVGSQILSMFQQKKAGQADAKGGAAMSMKVMMFIMPIMMVFFAIQSASVFSLYMVANSACSLLFNLLFTGIIKLIDKRRSKRNYGIATGSTRNVFFGEGSPIIHYVKGANPDAGKKVAATAAVGSAVAGDKKTKKEKGKKPTAVVRDGRPDPNELMNYDRGNWDNNKKK